MREMSVREANQNFSKVIAEAEAGETIIIIKNGKSVAKISPAPEDLSHDPERRAARDALLAHLSRPRPSISVGTITEADKYDDDKWSK